MASKYTITDLQAVLFGPQAYPYFKEATEAKDLGTWDFNKDGNMDAFDLSFYEISLMVYEEWEVRKSVAEQNDNAFNQEFTTSTGEIFKFSDFSETDVINYINGLLGVKAKDKGIKFEPPNKRDTRGMIMISTSGDADGLNQTIDLNKLFISNNTKFRNLVTKTIPLMVGSNNKGFIQIGDYLTFGRILTDMVLVTFATRLNGKPNRNQVVTHYPLNNPDYNYFHILPNVARKNMPLSIFDISSQSISLYGQDNYNYSPNGFFKENYIFKSTDSYSDRIDKIKNYARLIYGLGAKLGVVDYTSRLANVENIPIPSAHATYVPALKTDSSEIIEDGYKINDEGNATEFMANYDIPYFRHNIENVLIPAIRAKVKEVIRLAINKGTTDIPNLSAIDFSTKEIADLVSALCDGYIEYVKDKYNITDAEVDQYGILFTANNASDFRLYPDRQIIEKPVWKLIKCQTNEEYFTYQNEFYDYSISGIFHLSNLEGTNPDSDIPASDNLFLNQNVGGVFAGIYYLKNFTEDQIRDTYNSDYYVEGLPEAPFLNPWNQIKDQNKIMFYDHATGDLSNPLPHVPVGCYKIYLNIFPALLDGSIDRDRILSYQALPHYWEHADCSKPPCYVPPSPTPTQSPTFTPSCTMSPTISATSTQTPTITPSVTQTQTITNTPTQTQTITSTPTQTPSHTPSVTKTITPTLSPQATASCTATPTTTTSFIPPKDCKFSESGPIPLLTQTRTPSQTPTQSATKPICTHTQTPTQTPTSSARVTPTHTPSPSTTKTVTASHTATPTVTPSKAQEYGGTITIT